MITISNDYLNISILVGCPFINRPKSYYIDQTSPSTGSGYRRSSLSLSTGAGLISHANTFGMINTKQTTHLLEKMHK